MQKQTFTSRFFSWSLRWGVVLAFFLAGAFILYNQSQNLLDFKTAVLPGYSNVYDGLAFPIQKVPRWENLSSMQWQGFYENIPEQQFMSLPLYDPPLLKTPLSNVSSQSFLDTHIRNLKNTYPAVYMGNYKLDGIEYAGSHLGTDIRTPKNTPVYAMGNGIVAKVGNQTDGYGLHVVLKHENFPSFLNAAQTETLYSSYCHLGQILVSEGQIIHKGDLIAKSGQTGLASVPHLHFQIDNDQSPWHPYWPFTFLETQAANVDFIGAVNMGLGREKALQVTINPLMYVQKYLVASGVTLHGSSPKNLNSVNSSKSNKKIIKIKRPLQSKTLSFLSSEFPHSALNVSIFSSFYPFGNSTWKMAPPPGLFVTQIFP